jgi:hypothetical protein
VVWVVAEASRVPVSPDHSETTIAPNAAEPEYVAVTSVPGDPEMTPFQTSTTGATPAADLASSVHATFVCVIDVMSCAPSLSEVQMRTFPTVGVEVNVTAWVVAEEPPLFFSWTG